MLFIVEYLAADFDGLEFVLLSVVVEVAAVDAEVTGGVADGYVTQFASLGALELQLPGVRHLGICGGQWQLAGLVPDLAVYEDGAAFALAGKVVVVDEVIDGLLADAAFFGELGDGEIIVLFLLAREEFLQPFAAVVSVPLNQASGTPASAALDLMVFSSFLNFSAASRAEMYFFCSSSSFFLPVLAGGKELRVSLMAWRSMRLVLGPSLMSSISPRSIIA